MRRSPRCWVIIDDIHDVDSSLQSANASLDGLPDVVHVAPGGVPLAPAPQLAGALRALLHGVQCAAAGTVDPCVSATRRRAPFRLGHPVLAIVEGQSRQSIRALESDLHFAAQICTIFGLCNKRKAHLSMRWRRAKRNIANVGDRALDCQGSQQGCNCILRMHTCSLDASGERSKPTSRGETGFGIHGMHEDGHC